MEYIGLLISILALIFLFIKQQSAPRQSEETTPYNPEEEDETLLEFIQKRENAVKKMKPPSPPQIKSRVKPSLEKHRIESEIEKRRIKSELEARQLKPSVRAAEDLSHLHLDGLKKFPSKAEIALKHLGEKKDLIIYQEIIGKPRALRPYDFLW